jgi:hypothetical protein
MTLTDVVRKICDGNRPDWACLADFSVIVDKIRNWSEPSEGELRIAYARVLVKMRRAHHTMQDFTNSSTRNSTTWNKGNIIAHDLAFWIRLRLPIESLNARPMN